jgi:predicted RNA methylase
LEEYVEEQRKTIASCLKIVLCMTNEGDLVVDAYIGVGTTAVACCRQGRRSAGADIDERYLRIARNRVEKAWTGALKVRPLNKPVYTPNSNMTLARVPEEWTAQPKHENQVSKSRLLFEKSNSPPAPED